MAVSVSGSPGAQFWAYVSPQNNTSKVVTTWEVTISQGSWSGTITSANPTQQLQTPGLSGTFQVQVLGGGPNFPPHPLTVQGSPPDIGCNANCASMVGIVANAAGSDANYWTTWDAICR